jgi:hypothetical protein
MTASACARGSALRAAWGNGAGISQTRVAESPPAGFCGGEKARHYVRVARRPDSSAPRLTPTAAFALALKRHRGRPSTHCARTCGPPPRPQRRRSRRQNRSGSLRPRSSRPDPSSQPRPPPRIFVGRDRTSRIDVNRSLKIVTSRAMGRRAAAFAILDVIRPRDRSDDLSVWVRLPRGRRRGASSRRRGSSLPDKTRSSTVR